MSYYHMYPSSINERYLEQIVELLRRGGTVVYPTDTLYAIGCDALNNRAVERVCRIRDINPAKQRLSMVCDDISQASEFARIDNNAFRIIRDNTPGPFTFILPASTSLAKQFKGRKEVGVRIPANEIARRIARELGSPLLSATATWPEAEDEQLIHPEEVMARVDGAVAAVIDAGQGPEPAAPSAVGSRMTAPSMPLSTPDRSPSPQPRRLWCRSSTLRSPKSSAKAPSHSVSDQLLPSANTFNHPQCYKSIRPQPAQAKPTHSHVSISSSCSAKKLPRDPAPAAIGCVRYRRTAPANPSTTAPYSP